MQSMTGYAKVVFESDIFTFKAEIKSVNNKNLNLKIKYPYTLNFLENSIRTEVAKYISRGSVDLKIDFIDKREIKDMFSYDSDLSHAYMHVLEEMELDLGAKFNNKLDILVDKLNVIQKKDFEIDENEYSTFILNKLDELLEKLNCVRSDEGKRLLNYFAEKINIIKEKVDSIKLLKDQVVINYKDSLLERLSKIQNDIHFTKEDILKEILLFTDKADISEELSRLDSHLIQLKIDINSNEKATGKKIDFILQEIFRELNTAGVKGNMYDISKLIVECKNELEKLREQAMNIE